MDKIGVLTSGGDCPGLNMALDAILRQSQLNNLFPVGILQGTMGLLHRPIQAHPLHEIVKNFGPDWSHQGGTILGSSNKGNPFAFVSPDGKVIDRSHEVIDAIHKLGLKGLIAIGGDGSMDILYRLSQRGGFPLIGIPKTIDNDVMGTDIAIGHDTAITVATTALDHLRPTAASHQRAMILEVMGRGTGHIALSCGIAGGAQVILMPEIQPNMSKVINYLKNLRDNAQKSFLLVIAEGTNLDYPAILTAPDINVGHRLAKIVQHALGIESRATILGHVQRGAPPNARDRLLAAALGSHAVTLARRGQWGHLVVWQNNHAGQISFGDLYRDPKQPSLNASLLTTAKELGICLGT